ncbi:oxidoreductase family [Aureococcus anophagefferens]|nr:oxidoreductase family [Aureococcus anophagefferens]
MWSTLLAMFVTAFGGMSLSHGPGVRPASYWLKLEAVNGTAGGATAKYYAKAPLRRHANVQKALGLVTDAGAATLTWTLAHFHLRMSKLGDALKPGLGALLAFAVVQQVSVVLADHGLKRAAAAAWVRGGRVGAVEHVSCSFHSPLLWLFDDP